MILQRALKWEANRLAQTPPLSPVVAPILAQVDAAHWEDEATWRRILAEIWRATRPKILPPENVQTMMKSMDDESIEREVEEILPDLDGDEWTEERNGAADELDTGSS